MCFLYFSMLFGGCEWRDIWLLRRLPLMLLFVAGGIDRSDSLRSSKCRSNFSGLNRNFAFFSMSRALTQFERNSHTKSDNTVKGNDYNVISVFEPPAARYPFHPPVCAIPKWIRSGETALFKHSHMATATAEYAEHTERQFIEWPYRSNQNEQYI